MRETRGKCQHGISKLLVFVLFSLCTGSEAVLQIFRDFFSSRNTCQTTPCHEAAKSIEANRNSSVSPCDDFYEFTCGGWMAEHPVPENNSRRTQFQEMHVRTDLRIKGIMDTENASDDPASIKKAREFYTVCKNLDDNADKNMQALLDRLAVWGGWPIATENWDESKFDWKKLAVDLLRTNNIAPLFTIKVSLDRRNSSRTAVMIGQAKILFCFDHAMMDNTTADDNNTDAMKDWVVKVAQEIARASNQNVSEEQMIDDAINILSFESDLCQKQEAERQNDFLLYNRTTIKELQNLTDNVQPLNERYRVKWLELLKNYLEGSAIEIDQNYEVILAKQDYIPELISVLHDNGNLRTLANYMLWQKIAHFHKDISNEFLAMGHEYSRKVNGVGYEPRWKMCMAYVRKYMGHAIGYEYVKLYFDEDEKKKAKELVTDILESFIEDLKEIDWMDAKTRSLAVEKAENMVMEVGYPNWYDMKNKTSIEEYYATVIVDESHFVNIENFIMARFSEGLQYLTKPLNRSTFDGSPIIANAYYMPSINGMGIPAAMWQYPFYKKGRPEAMNYGGIGAVIGHEISHAFDLEGRLADKFGNLAQWWDEGTLNTYRMKQECFEQQYNEYPLSETETEQIDQLDGDGTVSENIADNGGLRQAYEAYRRYVKKHGRERMLPGLKEYSSEQLFFIGYATMWCETSTPQSIIADVMTDFHSPSKYRALIPLGNFEEFAEKWNCRGRKDSKMKLNRTCQFW